MRSELLADFARTHPRILLNVQCDLTLNLIERFENQAFALVLVKVSRPGRDYWVNCST